MLDLWRVPPRPEPVILLAMFTMLNYRIVAALIGVEIFLTTVLFPEAGLLLGAALGAVGGAVIFAVGRYVLDTVELPDGAPALRWLLFASAAAFLALFSFYLVMSGPGGAGRWGGVAGLVAALLLIGVASVRLNRLMAEGIPIPDEDA